MSKGTPWVNKSARLRCRCGRTVHFELRGKCTLVYDAEPKEDRQVKVDSASPSSTLSLPTDEPEPPASAEDDSDG